MRGACHFWIALTDATTSNGCMHLVPRRRLPAAFARDWTVCPEVAIVDAVEALHAVRSLPCRRCPHRLSMIATAVCAYEKFERGLARYRPVAERLGD